MVEVTASFGTLGSHEDAPSGRPAEDALAEVAGCIRSAATVFITGHVNPDGDALGSQVALAEGLRRLGKRVRLLNAQPPPEKYRGLLPEEVFELISDPQEIAALDPPDLCVLVDTSEPERAGPFRELFFAADQRRVCLDHHVHRGEARFHAQAIVTPAPATGSLVLALLDRLGVDLDREIAQAVWIAIATDTGWFRYPNATEWAFRDAARLIRYGIDLETIHAQIYLESPLARSRLLGKVLASIEESEGGRFIWSLVTQQQIRDADLGLDALDGMVDSLKTVRGARVMALIVELDHGLYKVSLRARGEPDVERIARRFGGGGHAKAAGCRFAGSYEELVERLRELVRSELAGSDRGAPP